MTIRIAPRAEVAAICGDDAAGCYSGGELVFIGEPVGGLEAGGHGAARVRTSHRGEPGESAVACARLGNEALGDRRAGLLACRWRYGVPGGRGRSIRLEPGRGVRRGVSRAGRAEGRCHALLVEHRGRQLLPRCSRAECHRAGRGQAVAGSVPRPRCAAAFSRTARAGVSCPSRRRSTVELTVELRLPRGRLDTLELLSPGGRVLARGLWAGTSTRRLSLCRLRAASPQPSGDESGKPGTVRGHRHEALTRQ